MNGPVFPEGLAEQAAEAVRRLNHATLFAGDRRGYVYPGDVDQTLANLSVLVDRLPQALRQASRWLDARSAAGLVRHDAYLDREESTHRARLAVLELVEHLDAAAARLVLVGADLARARSQATHLAGFPEDDDQGDDDAEDDGVGGAG